jgi:hypothetical protein
VSVSVRECVCVYVRVFVYLCVCMCVCACMCVSVYRYRCVNICMYMYVCTYLKLVHQPGGEYKIIGKDPRRLHLVHMHEHRFTGEGILEDFDLHGGQS